MPDWPADLTTFKERQAYQRGVAHARFLAQNTHADEMRVAATVARYREESIRDNFGSPDEFLEMCEHDDAVRKLSEIVWEFNGFSTEVAKVNGVAIGHVALRGRPDYDDAYEVILYNSAGEKDAAAGKSVPAAIAHVGPGQDKPRFLKMAEEALANGTPSDVLTTLRASASRVIQAEPDGKQASIEQLRELVVDLMGHADDFDACKTDEEKRRFVTDNIGENVRMRNAAHDANEALAKQDADEKLPDATIVFSAIEKANDQLRPAGLPTYGDLVAALAEVAKKVPFCPEQDTAARLVEQVQSAGGVRSSARARMRP